MALGLLVSEILHCLLLLFFFLYGQDILVQIIISITLRYHWRWLDIFHMTIIKSEESIPKCDFKRPEICDVKEKCMGDGQDTCMHIRCQF